GGGGRRPLQEDHGGREGRGAGTEVDDQHDGGPAAFVRGRGHAGRDRGGYGRQARRTGGRAGRLGHVEGPDRVGELHGRQPHLAGAQHRRRDEGGGGGRPLQENHGGREGRGARAQVHDQHDGGPALLLRRGSDAGGARGRNGRQARRPGRGARRLWNLEGPDRLRELDGRQPHLAGEEHRRRDQGRSGGRPVEEDRGGRQGRDPRAQEHHHHDGRPAPLLRCRG